MSHKTGGAGELMVARQPIFDRGRDLFGYELLFRRADTPESGVRPNEGDAATAATINTSLNVVGLHALTGGKQALINITRRVLLDEMYTVLPRELAVIELLETVEPDADVVAACRRLKSAGYQLALDDFIFHPRFKPLLELADILKVDFLLSPSAERTSIAQRFGPRMKLLAEKVETHEDVKEAMGLGYSYFQGFFYCKPQLVSSRQVPAGKRHHLRFLQEVTREDACFDRLEALVKQEMSLSVKLLRYLNSSAFGLRCEVISIKHAMSLLGLDALRKWAALVAMTSIAQRNGNAIVATCLARARFCESIGATMPSSPGQTDLFLTGLLSGLDAMLNCPMSQVLAHLSLPGGVRDALTGARSPLRDALDLALANEQADWPRVTSLSAALGVTCTTVARAGLEAATWADRVSSL